MAPESSVSSPKSTDVIVVGAGLAGLVAAAEAADAGCRVLLLDQEGELRAVVGLARARETTRRLRHHAARDVSAPE